MDGQEFKVTFTYIVSLAYMSLLGFEDLGSPMSCGKCFWACSALCLQLSLLDIYVSLLSFDLIKLTKSNL